MKNIAFQTYMDAATIQSMLSRLRRQVNWNERCIKTYKNNAQLTWVICDKNDAATEGSFKVLNNYKDEIRQYKKELAMLVKQIKGLKDMLKDAV